MTINFSKLVSTNVFQDGILDKDTGAPLSGGLVYCYVDVAGVSPVTPKTVYFQTGTFGNYSYSAFTNPIVLNSIGVVADGNGNQVLPFFYPWNEQEETDPQKYWIEVYSATGVFQYSLRNFPWEAGDGPTPPSTSANTYKNYLVNTAFWRNIQTYTSGNPPTPNPINLSAVTDLVVCPSQHDGFSMPDVRFQKDQTSATESATFVKFDGTAQLVDGTTTDVTPEFYISHTCTVRGNAETYRYYQWPLSFHLLTMAEQQVTFSVWAKDNGSGGNNTIAISYWAFYGTGQETLTSPQVQAEWTLNTDWQKWDVAFTLPTVVPANISATGDDAWYIQVRLPTNTEFNVEFTKPCINLGNLEGIDVQEFATYDQVDTVINSPRTGDYRTSLNNFQPFGWVAANDTTIGNFGSSATGRANSDTWPLYNLIWSNVADVWAPMADASPRGADAHTDFTAERAMYLTKNLGRVIQGLNPIMTPGTFTAVANVITFTRSGNELLCTNTFTAGTPVMLTTTGGLPAPLAINTIYYISSSPAPTGTGVYLSTTLANAAAGENVILTSAGSGTNSITTTNQFTLTTPQLFVVGTPVVVSSSVSLPNGLLANTVYYVSSTSLTNTTFNLSFSVDDAEAGINVPITTTGSGTLTVSNALGAYFGSGYHSEVPNHLHPWNSGSSHNFVLAGGQSLSGSGSNWQLDPNYNVSIPTKENAGVTFVRNSQPTVSLNVFIKL